MWPNKPVPTLVKRISALEVEVGMLQEKITYLSHISVPTIFSCCDKAVSLHDIRGAMIDHLGLEVNVSPARSESVSLVKVKTDAKSK